MTDYIKKVFFDATDKLFVQFVRSVMAGAAASVADISIYGIGVNLLGINHIVSNTFSFIFGLSVNYYLSREWVFNKKKRNTKRDFLLFSLIGIIGLLLSSVLLYILVDLGTLYYLLMTENSGLVKSAAKIFAVILVFFWNFIARKRVVFST